VNDWRVAPVPNWPGTVLPSEGVNDGPQHDPAFLGPRVAGASMHGGDFVPHDDVAHTPGVVVGWISCCRRQTATDGTKSRFSWARLMSLTSSGRSSTGRSYWYAGKAWPQNFGVRASQISGSLPLGLKLIHYDPARALQRRILLEPRSCRPVLTDCGEPAEWVAESPQPAAGTSDLRQLRPSSTPRLEGQNVVSAGPRALG